MPSGLSLNLGISFSFSNIQGYLTNFSKGNAIYFFTNKGIMELSNDFTVSFAVLF